MLRWVDFVADRVGRKTVFSATLVIFGLANGGMALSWSLAALLIARLIIGLGLGCRTASGFHSGF